MSLTKQQHLEIIRGQNNRREGRARMSSLNITAEIKAPRLCLIKTQKNQSSLLSMAEYRGPSDVSGYCLDLGTAGLAFKGPSLTHITSRRVLISESDNNYQEEYTQNDFL